MTKTKTTITRRTFLSGTATLSASVLLALAGGCNRDETGGGGDKTNTANKSRRETLTVGYLPVT